MAKKSLLAIAFRSATAGRNVTRSVSDVVPTRLVLGVQELIELLIGDLLKRIEFGFDGFEVGHPSLPPRFGH